MDRTQWTDKNSKREAVSQIKWILRCEGSGVGVASLKGTRLSSTIGPASISKSVMSWSEKERAKSWSKNSRKLWEWFFLEFSFPVSKLKWVFKKKTKQFYSKVSQKFEFMGLKCVINSSKMSEIVWAFFVIPIE